MTKFKYKKTKNNNLNKLKLFHPINQQIKNNNQFHKNKKILLIYYNKINSNINNLNNHNNKI